MGEDFPINEVEFDRRFHSEEVCIDYLFNFAGLTGFGAPVVAKKVLDQF